MATASSSRARCLRAAAGATGWRCTPASAFSRSPASTSPARRPTSSPACGCTRCGSVGCSRACGPMPESLPAPDAEYLQGLAAELNDLYLDDDRQLDDARNQREMRIPAMAGTDPRYKIVDVDPRDPDVTEEAFQQTAIMTMERPKLQLKAGEGDTAQTNAS